MSSEERYNVNDLINKTNEYDQHLKEYDIILVTILFSFLPDHLHICCSFPLLCRPFFTRAVTVDNSSRQVTQIPYQSTGEELLLVGDGGSDTLRFAKRCLVCPRVRYFVHNRQFF